MRLAGLVSQVDACDFGSLDDGGGALTLVAGVDVAYWPPVNPAGATVCEQLDR